MSKVERRKYERGWEVARRLRSVYAVRCMARNARPTTAKREREKALIERRQQKVERRRAEKERKAGAAPSPDGVDPDIADIKLGPQPPAEWQIDE